MLTSLVLAKRPETRSNKKPENFGYYFMATFPM
ncbi:hypothetical protein ACWA1C_13380 [Flectobacillus roseus]